IAITSRHQRQHFRPGEMLVNKADVQSFGCLPEFRPLRWITVAVDGFYHQGGILPGTGGPKSLEQRQGVLPLDKAHVIEREKKREGVWLNSETGPIRFETTFIHVHHVGYHFNRNRRASGNALLTERALRPDFIVKLKLRAPALGKLLEFPPPQTNVVPVLEIPLPDYITEYVGRIRVNVNEVDRVRIIGRERRQAPILVSMQAVPDAVKGAGYVRTLECTDVRPGRLAIPKFTA